MGLHIKGGVNLRGMVPQIALAIQIATDAFAEQNEDCTITSLTRDGTFAECGFHSVGAAVDISVAKLGGNPIEQYKVDRVLWRLETVIGRQGGGQFDIVDERAPGSSPGWTGAHIHIEFDPK